MAKQKVVSSKTIFKAKLFQIEELHMDIPENAVFHQVNGNATVLVLPLTDKYELYLIDQYRFMFSKHVMGAIAGYIDDGENALQAAKRELLEEAGIEAGQLELIAKLENSRSVIHSTVYIFLAKNLEVGKANPEEDEEITLVKLSLSDAVKKVLSGEIYHTASIAGILLLDKLKSIKRI